jgi:nucleoside-diphosphate-sugar epimerase
MSLHVIVGAGPVGSGTAQVLAEAGHDVRLISRSGRRGATGHPRIEPVAADATDAAALRELTTGAAALYNCANPPYHRWPQDWPPIAGAMLAAAEHTGAVLVIMGNLYGYGPVDSPMSEDTPLAATGTKGRVRAGMWADALAAHRSGRIRATEARASDFYGPHIVSNAMIGERFVPSVLAGRPVYVLGDPDAPHTWSYLPDVANTLAVLGTDERAWGRAWHVPSPPPLSQRALARRLAELAGPASRGCAGFRTLRCAPPGCSRRSCGSSGRPATSSPGRSSWTPRHSPPGSATRPARWTTRSRRRWPGGRPAPGGREPGHDQHESKTVPSRHGPHPGSVPHRRAARRSRRAGGPGRHGGRRGQRGSRR